MKLQMTETQSDDRSGVTLKSVFLAAAPLNRLACAMKEPEGLGDGREAKHKHAKLWNGLSALAVSFVAAISVPTSARGQDDQIEEITVTAQRRVQNVQDTSISITAFGTDAIQALRISEPADLGRLTPGLVMKPTGGSQDPIFTMRGIGMNSLEANSNPAVGVYVDEVVMPYVPMLGFQLFDLERIEVLKGPQGTLYGRNTTGGAINFISRKPTQEFDANMRLDYGHYDLVEVEGGVGGGISDTVAVRLAATGSWRNGWQTLRLGPDAADSVDSRNGEVDRQAIRASLLWEPSSRFDALVTVDAGRDDSEVIALEHAGNVSRSNPGAGNLCVFGTEGVRSEGASGECASLAIRRDPETGIPLTGDLEVVFDTTPEDLRDVAASFSWGNRVDAESTGISGTLHWYLDGFTITSVTGFRDFERLNGLDNASPFVVSDGTQFTGVDAFSQELRLASSETWENIDWLAGIYYSEDDLAVENVYDYQDHFEFFGLFNWDYDQTTTTYAAFSNATWQLNSEWALEGGLRATREEKSITFFGSNPRSGPIPISSFQDKISTNDLSGTIGLDYTPTDNLLLYGKVSKGFKASGFPSAISFSESQLAPYDKETIFAYEAGLKSTLGNGRLQFNTAIYYYDWQNFQAEAAVERSGVRVIVLTNAGDARVEGLEAEAVWLASPELRTKVGFNWMDSEILSGQYEGNTTAHAPEITLNGLIEWQNSVEIRGVFPFAQLDFSFRDDVEYILPNAPGAEGDSYWLANARAGVKGADGDWELAGWISNISDKTYRTDVYGPGSTFLPGRIVVGAPRMYGVSFIYHF